MSNDDGRFSQARLNKLAAMKIEQNAREHGASGPKPGVPLNFSVEVNDLRTRAESDPSSAMKLLELLAKDLRMRTLPNRMLADYIADAIELAAAKPIAYQARALTDELYLTTQERRPAHSWLEIGSAMRMLVSRGVSQTQAKVEVAVEFGVDERTALNYYKKYVAAKEQHDNIE